MGGHTDRPTYMDICNGNTGHAEVIRVDFDADVVSFDELLLAFFKTHDPTTLNRQGNDAGTQYRSVVFYQDEDQRQRTVQLIDRLTEEKIFDRPIVTEVAPLSEFYEAEAYHQNYFNQNSGKPYCAFVIQPKLNKFIRDFAPKLKPLSR